MKLKNILISSVALLGFVACEKSEGVSSILPSDNIIRVSAGVTATRAGAETSNLTEFGMFVNHNEGLISYAYYNVKATKVGAEWSTSEMMLWKNATNSVLIEAYAPYQEGFDIAGVTTQVSVKTDQNTAENVIASDFLYSSATVTPSADQTQEKINYDKIKKCLNVELDHRFSKLLLTVKLGSEFNANGGAEANPITNITVNGTNTTLVLWFRELSDPAPITPLFNGYTTPASQTANGVAKYEAIIIPQKPVSGALSVSITINGKIYEWKSTTEVIFGEGKTHALTLNVGKDVVSAEGMTVGDWTNGTGGDIVTD